VKSGRNFRRNLRPASSEHSVYCIPSSRVSQSGREVEIFRRKLRPVSLGRPVYYTPSTRVSQSRRQVRMFKRNLRLNRQNTPYIILQALACLSLVERHEC
jgi:hypothetical protein